LTTCLRGRQTYSDKEPECNLLQQFPDTSGKALALPRRTQIKAVNFKVSGMVLEYINVGKISSLIPYREKALTKKREIELVIFSDI
jgi:hypothetical protein